MSSLYVKTAPAVEPVTLDEVKQHLRVDIVDDDQVITNCIRSARWNLERTYRRACITQSLVLGLDFFAQGDPMWNNGWAPSTGFGYPLIGLGFGGYPLPGMGYAINPVIELRPPLQSVTSITYTDPSGNPQTFAGANYVVDTHSEPGRVMPAVGKIWPITAQLPGVVSIEFVAGYTSPDLVPDDIKQAIKLIAGVLYENREQTLIGGRLVAVELPYGVPELMAPFTRPLVR